MVAEVAVGENELFYLEVFNVSAVGQEVLDCHCLFIVEIVFLEVETGVMDLYLDYFWSHILS